MYGFTVTLEDGTQVLGIAFADGWVYVHNPICDSFASMEDMKASFPGCKVEMIGPVCSVEDTRIALEEEYLSAKKSLERRYEDSIRILSEYAVIPGEACIKN